MSELTFDEQLEQGDIEIPAILPVHRGQLLSYLKLGGFKLGFLLNFNVAHMRDGIVRLVNGL